MIKVNGNNVEWYEGMTVSDVLKIMGFKFNIIVVSVNGKNVPGSDFDSFQIPDGAEVKAIHILHGG